MKRLQEYSPIELIGYAAQQLGWDIALLNGPLDGEVLGIVLGTSEFIDSELTSPEEFVIYSHESYDKDDEEGFTDD